MAGRAADNSEGAGFGVVLPAAGTGSRFGAGDKLLADVGGKSVLQRSVGLFARRADVREIVIVTGAERFDVYRQHLEEVVSGERLAFVAGGRERWESVLFGLRQLAAMTEAPGFVAVHDAARPLTPAAVIDEAFRMAVEVGGALPCVAEPATLKRELGGLVSETVSRKGLHQAQTPQCFALGKLLAGYERLLAEGKLADVTDDAQIFERMGEKVAMTPGDALNLKITTAGDLSLARAIVASAAS